MATSISTNDRVDEKTTVVSFEAIGSVKMGEVEASSSISASSASSLVSWSDVLDPANPKNFSCGMKCLIGLVIGLMNLIVSFAISVFSGVEDQAKEAFYGKDGKDGNVMQLGVSLYIFGLAMGMLMRLEQMLELI